MSYDFGGESTGTSSTLRGRGGNYLYMPGFRSLDSGGTASYGILRLPDGFWCEMVCYAYFSIEFDDLYYLGDAYQLGAGYTGD